jgi:uncharacterized damage-inducible protein DinB
MPKPFPSQYPSFYATYVDLVQESDVVQALENNTAATLKAIANLPASKADFAYAPGKWTLKEVWLHMSDAERIFAYRLLRIGRNDKTPLAGFEENDYVANANAARLSFEDVLDEWQTVRRATQSLFKNLEPAAWERVGVANNKEITASAIGYIISGHIYHHLNIIQERYL